MRGGLHTSQVLPCIHRLGMLGAYAQVLELGRVFQTWRDSTCAKDKVSWRETRREEDCTQALTLFAKTWDAWSICTSVGAWESVPDLERFDLSKGEGVRGRDKVRGGYTQGLTLYP